MKSEGASISKTEDERIVAACDALKGLADHLAELLANEKIAADTPTQQLLARQAVFVVRQVYGVALLVALPFYAEQAGQLVRGLAELTRIILWLDAPDDAERQFEQAVIFWKDGIQQTRSKYEYQGSTGRQVLPHEWEQLANQEKLIADQEAKLGRKVGGLPNAKKMWEDLGREDLHGLFRWESDPAHGSAVTLGTVVRSNTEEHFDLGGPNQPKDRARRLGAALALLQLSGDVIVERLGRNIESWQAASSETEAQIADLLSPLMPAAE
ncbi:MAG TPA: hypothetical protein VJA46_05890 [Acidimicrobiia bacterium]|nr:hypothetical protein [Acidimicrobiia bacterium]